MNILNLKLSCSYLDTTDNSTVKREIDVTIIVGDVNDHAPRFINAPYAVGVSEVFVLIIHLLGLAK